ncbi:dihydrodipicolinate synthetase [Candidatus Vecturithrix granuli]|uniref:Dihydrodipicolinate synthetase n=1 Tax=Vecturithrix granuli TaxID=1499967 RepID=A0A0S6W6H3_VECG1|nr:dihydrodipicolinate synthetase [Candidatus Vecturithrix granuli]
MNTVKQTLPGGVFAANLTPQHPDLRVDAEKLLTHCRWLLTHGCNGLAVMGTTGEANSFSVKERMEILDALLQGGISPGVFMLGTGCSALTDSVELTRHALEHGVSNVLMLPPFYYKNISDDGVFRSIAEVIERVGNAQMQIYLYHFPNMSAVPFSVEVVQRLLDRYPHIIAGMKDSSGDWKHIKSMCEEFPGFRLYAGTEKYLLDALEVGGVGCISATTNVTCGLAAKVFDAWQARDLDRAHELQAYLTTIRVTFEHYPFIPGLKSYLAHITDQDHWLAMRPPFLPLSDEKLSVLLEALRSHNFTLEYA